MIFQTLIIIEMLILPVYAPHDFFYKVSRLQFAPILKVVSIQRIDISVRQRDDFSITHEVYIDDRLLKFDEFCELSKNDGFDSIEDFKAWFNKDLRGGKIIHWTDKRY